MREGPGAISPQYSSGVTNAAPPRGIHHTGSRHGAIILHVLRHKLYLRYGFSNAESDYTLIHEVLCEDVSRDSIPRCDPNRNAGHRKLDTTRP